MRMELIDRIQMNKVLNESLNKLETDENFDDSQKLIMKTCINYTINLLKASHPIVVTSEEEEN